MTFLLLPKVLWNYTLNFNLEYGFAIESNFIHFVKNNNQNTDYSSLRIMVSVNSLHLDEPPKSPVRDWPSWKGKQIADKIQVLYI